MRPITLRMSAAGYSAWVPINRMQQSFVIGLAVNISTGATMTFSVQYSLDDPNDPMNLTQVFTLSRSTTTLTVTKTAHGLIVGDSVKLWGNGGAPLDLTSNVVAITDLNNFTVTVADSGLSAGNRVGWLQTMRALAFADMAAKSASLTGRLELPVTAVRLNVSAYTSGTADLQVIQARG
jgi:hypothetical protein